MAADAPAYRGRHQAMPAARAEALSRPPSRSQRLPVAPVAVQQYGAPAGTGRDPHYPTAPSPQPSPRVCSTRTPASVSHTTTGHGERSSSRHRAPPASAPAPHATRHYGSETVPTAAHTSRSVRSLATVSDAPARGRRVPPEPLDLRRTVVFSSSSRTAYTCLTGSPLSDSSCSSPSSGTFSSRSSSRSSTPATSPEAGQSAFSSPKSGRVKAGPSVADRWMTANGDVGRHFGNVSVDSVNRHSQLGSTDSLGRHSQSDSSRALGQHSQSGSSDVLSRHSQSGSADVLGRHSRVGSVDALGRHFGEGSTDTFNLRSQQGSVDNLGRHHRQGSTDSLLSKFSGASLPWKSKKASSSSTSLQLGPQPRTERRQTAPDVSKRSSVSSQSSRVSSIGSFVERFKPCSRGSVSSFVSPPRAVSSPRVAPRGY